MSKSTNHRRERLDAGVDANDIIQVTAFQRNASGSQVGPTAPKLHVRKP